MNSNEPRIRYITPTLPTRAGLAMAAWRSKGQYHRAFIRPLIQIEGSHCGNCIDADFVMVSFVRAGPFASVPNHNIGEAITWFDGDERAGKGWYIIHHTISYNCPLCRPEGDRLESPHKQLELLDQDEFPWQSYVE